MGKIYRIPIPSKLGLIRPRTPTHSLVFGLGTCLAIALYAGLGTSGTGGAALLLTFGSLPVIFFVSLFWEDWSSATRKTIIFIGTNGILCCLALGVLRVLYLFDPSSGIDLWHGAPGLTQAKFEAFLMVRPAMKLLDLVPMVLSSLHFVYTIRGAQLEDYCSDA